MSVEQFSILFLVPWALFAIGWIIHIIRIHRFRMRLLDEEDKWASSHLGLWAKYKRFRRYDALPSYWKMMFQFWKSIDNFKEEIKPVENYYR